MKKLNTRSDIRMKMTDTKRKNGTVFFPVRGGNGRGLTRPQKLLLSLIGGEPEHPIKTKRRKDGWPHCYKVDLGFPNQKVAVEIDGPTHSAKEQKVKDRLKETRLVELGWTVLRLTNSEILSDPDGAKEKVLKALGFTT
jgi:hypothetical protein